MTISSRTMLAQAVLIAIVASVSAASANLAWRWWHTEYVATAEILVRDRSGSPVTQRPLPPPFADDLGLTHMMILQSPAVIDFAVTQGRLGSLASLRDADDVGANVTRMLTVRRHRSADAKRDHVIRIECRGLIADDCDAVLSAVLESYEGFLARSYSAFFATNMPLLKKEQALVREELRVAELQYARFREDAERPFFSIFRQRRKLPDFINWACRRFELSLGDPHSAEPSIELRDEIKAIHHTAIEFAACLREERRFFVEDSELRSRVMEIQHRFDAAQRRLHDLKAWDPANFKVEIRSRTPAAAGLSDSH